MESHIQGIKRIDTLEIPIEALREVIVNAIVHRDYSIRDSIKIAIFDNRVEITSPGNLPRSLDIDMIKKGRSEIRNVVIARFFKELGFIEQWGTGIRKIIALCVQNNLKEPEFFDDGTSFKVIIYRKVTSESAGIVPESAGIVPESEINEKERLVLKLLQDHGSASRKDIQDLLRMSERGVRKLLSKLENKGFIKQIGKGKNTKYVLRGK